MITDLRTCVTLHHPVHNYVYATAAYPCGLPLTTGVSHTSPSDIRAPHGQNPRQYYRTPAAPRPTVTMDRYLTRPQSPVLISQGDPEDYVRTLMAEDSTQPAPSSQHPSSPQALLTPELLDFKLQALAQQLTRGIAQEVGKISRELRGEINELGEHTATLETTFDETIHYLQPLEEENVSLKHSDSQLKLQQEDLENRERWKTLGSLEYQKRCLTTSDHTFWAC